MRIAVNTRLLLENKLEGIGWFTYETLKRITQQHPEHEFIFIFDRKPSREFIFAPNVTPVVAHPQARHPLLWYLFFEWGIPAVLKKHKADIFLSTDGWVSLRAGIKTFNVIHDLNFEEYPEFIPWHIRKYYHHFFPRYARKSARIATVSEYTRQDLVKRYGYNYDNIDVVYNGAHGLYHPLKPAEVNRVREKLSAGCPYFVFVGLIHPRKNLKNILLAFEEFKKATTNNFKFVVVGEKKWWAEDLDRAYQSMEYKDDVVFLGRLHIKELQHVLASAFSLVYTSYFEGFGIPILEAMTCGVPVITSELTSMPEVGGNAAMYANPFSISSISQKMLELYNNNTVRKQMIADGFIQSKQFSWDRTAELLWESIEKMIQE
ncbi:MAG: glycosyltransferase [Bacteroidetes bacterium]|jgi:glycosyltransferase involved in cell wall biosynthesis|nr:glycosyltransferase [Bacteroidota bacterium]